MFGLVQAQFSESTKKLWLYVFLVLCLNSLISTTQLSWDFYIERYSYWNIVLCVTNNPIDIKYVFTLISTLLMLSSLNVISWNQSICVRSVTRRKYFTSILMTHGIKTALFVLMILFSCYVQCLLYPVTFQDDWGLITAAGAVVNHKPQDLVLLSAILLFLRFFCLGLIERIVAIATKRRALGIIVYLLLPFAFDAEYGAADLLPSKLQMMNNTLVAVQYNGEWIDADAMFSILYWLAIMLFLILVGYCVIRKMDLSDKGA